MKRTITVLLAIIIVVPVFSQETSEIKSDAAHLSRGFQKGSKWVAELGAGFYAESTGWGGYADGSLDLRFIWSYQFNPFISIGLGTGLSLYAFSGGYNAISGTDLSVPVFFDVTLNVLDRKVSPFITFRGGHSIYINEDNDFFVNPAVGITINTSGKLSINVGVDSEIHFKEWLTFGLNVGLSF